MKTQRTGIIAGLFFALSMADVPASAQTSQPRDQSSPAASPAAGSSPTATDSRGTSPTKTDNTRSGSTNPDDRGSRATERAQQSPTPQNNPEGAVIFESWTLYIDQVEREAISVYFDKGSSTLSPLERMRITDWAGSMRQGTQSLAAVVASWSDQPYPTSKTALPKADRDLADARNAVVRDTLRQAGVSSLETFSMTERPNWFQRFFATDAAQIKGEARNKNWDTKNEDRIAAILQRRGGPSKSVIIFRPITGSTLTGGR